MTDRIKRVFLIVLDSCGCGYEPDAELFGDVGAFLPGYEFDALVLRPTELDALVERTPFEQLEQFLYDGDDRSIAARYCAGALVPQPFPDSTRG